MLPSRQSGLNRSNSLPASRCVSNFISIREHERAFILKAHSILPGVDAAAALNSDPACHKTGLPYSYINSVAGAPAGNRTDRSPAAPHSGNQKTYPGGFTDYGNQQP